MGKRPIERVFEILKGPSGVRAALREEGIELKTPWTCSKWLRAGRLPWTPRTREYALALERATQRAGETVTAAELLQAEEPQLAAM